MSTETKSTTIDRASGFSGELWEAITPTYEAIISHPFLASVTDGSLEPEKFVYFVGQDRLYLKAFSRALAYAAGHADNPDYTTLLTGSASTANAVEAGMHVELLEGFGIDLENAPEPRLSPNGELYVQTILAHSSRGPFANATTFTPEPSPSDRPLAELVCELFVRCSRSWGSSAYAVVREHPVTSRIQPTSTSTPGTHAARAAAR